MPASLSQQLICLVIVVNHLIIFSVATDFIMDSCIYGRFRGGYMYNWRCRRPQYHGLSTCFSEEAVCRTFLSDCLLLQFRCHRNGRCIPRSRVCNGIIDCNDASDEFGCQTTIPDFTTTITMSSGSLEDTSSHITTIDGDNEEKTTPSYLTTTSRMFPAATSNTISSLLPEIAGHTLSPPTTSNRFPISEANTAFSSSITTSSGIQDSQTNTAIPSSATTRNSFPVTEANTVSPPSITTSRGILESETNTAIPFSATTNSRFPTFQLVITSSSSTTSAKLSDSESSTAIPSSTTASTRFLGPVRSSSTTTRTILPNTEPSTVIPSSTKTRTNSPDFELKTEPSSSITTGTMLSAFESKTAIPTSSTVNTKFPSSSTNIAFSSSTETSNSVASSSSTSFIADKTMLSESEKKNLSSTNTIIPDSSAIQSCPNNYCLQNAECVVVQSRYLCKCPSSFTGEICEIQLGTKQNAYEYVLAISIFATCLILCLVVASLCIYRYKRSIAWKSNDISTRSLSQLTLTLNAVE